VTCNGRNRKIATRHGHEATVKAGDILRLRDAHRATVQPLGTHAIQLLELYERPTVNAVAGRRQGD